MREVNKIIPGWFEKILKKINQHAENSVHPYITFGIFGIITYPLYFFVWKFRDTSGYENLPLRLLVCLLCIPLIFHKDWPARLKKFLPLYWYLTLLYSLPFLFTFLLLKNNMSYVWTLNTMTVLVLSVLLLDLLELSIILPLGCLLGWLCYQATANDHFITLIAYQDILITYLSVIIFGAIFAHRKEKLQQEKIQALRAVGATIAHELRTPLSSLGISVKLLKNKIVAFLSGEKYFGKNDINGGDFGVTKLRHLAEEEFTSMEKEIRASFTFIDMLLINLNPVVNKSSLEFFSISQCIDEALSRYPFTGQQHHLIYWKKNSDFAVKGDPLLLTHVLFNLLKNALYYIDKAGKGDIQIRLEQDAPYNKLYFKDTGMGIPSNFLPHIFDQFFSKTYHGTGIGLTFCKWVMESFNGKIACESVEGDYTLFILSFPGNNENTT